jgi:hypothetical protein
MGIMLIQQIIYVWRYAHITILMTHMVTNILAIVYSAATYPILLLQTLIPVCVKRPVPFLRVYSTRIQPQ